MRDAQDPDVLTGPGRQEPPSAGRWRVPLGIAALVAAIVVAADQLTKRWALGALSPGSCSQPDACIDLFAGIRFHLVFNTGAAFTRGSGYGPVLAVLAFFMAGLLLYLGSKREDRLGMVLFGATAGGAIGNLLDRIFRADDGLLSGAVVDFIDVGWWPVFNVADSAIVVGVICIIVLSLVEAREDGDEAPETVEPTGEDPDAAAEVDDDDRVVTAEPGGADHHR